MTAMAKPFVRSGAESISKTLVEFGSIAFQASGNAVILTTRQRQHYIGWFAIVATSSSSACGEVAAQAAST
jgi:hypothetical protein